MFVCADNGFSTGCYEWSYNSAMYLTLQDCDLRGGQISLGQPDWYSYESVFWGSGIVSWINNSFDNVAIHVDPSYYWEYGYTNVDMAFSAYNNLFRGGLWFHLEPIPASAGNWVLNDNLFDQVNIVQDTAAPLKFSNNGYWPLSTQMLAWDVFCGWPWPLANSAKLQPTNSGHYDVTLGNAPPYQAGPFGNFYLPTNSALYGAGSRTPANAGLYHYCNVHILPFTPEGPSGRHFVPVYWVYWVRRSEEGRGSVATVEFLEPTRTLRQLRVEKPEYILRRPLAVAKLDVLLSETSAPPPGSVSGNQ